MERFVLSDRAEKLVKRQSEDISFQNASMHTSMPSKSETFWKGSALCVLWTIWRSPLGIVEKYCRPDNFRGAVELSGYISVVRSSYLLLAFIGRRLGTAATQDSQTSCRSCSAGLFSSAAGILLYDNQYNFCLCYCCTTGK